LTVEISNSDSVEEACNILRQLSNYSFTIADDSEIVNAEKVTATLIIPENYLSFTGYRYELDNNYRWQGQVSIILGHIFHRIWIRNEYGI
jgi:hypothetical protein